ncbi:MAG TPA: HAD family hydrolase [Novimethylophilus sp.]|jgi:3-deoxy-D-manno-octulosonate 8-phosphate phosphatase (KDO 8-P phosphatase)|uniref:KdsC family phosphatase n=1 Tax=Novimethylophilus sp. TaxID=2137426 RepID=UPI002F3E4867
MNEAIERARKIKLIIFDVDGVLTDGRLILGDDGLEYKAFNSHDGLGMKLLKASGVDMAIITGRTSNVVAKRAESTGIGHFYQGVEDKLEAFLDLLRQTGLTPEQCAFMGDDVVDLPPMRRCGFAVTVPAAPPLVKQHAHLVTSRGAGQGAVREICEFIMQAQDTYDEQMAQYLR